MMGVKCFDQFDMEFHFLNRSMQHVVVKVIKPFLEFLKAFDSQQVCNMLALIMDSNFKSLWIVKNFVGMEMQSTSWLNNIL
jgi:hypothetical protein